MVAECMSREPRTISPDVTLRDAARQMLDEDIGALVVGSQDNVAGLVTDRDIAVRGVAMGRGPEAKVSEVMSGGDIVVAYDDQDLDEVAITMSDRKVRRVPVLERATGKLCGVLSIGDLARSDDASQGETALSGSAQPGGEHSQKADGATGQSMQG
ncbi:MAG TPA: CBS domain-containing protein [Phenylobacterium sp.]